MDSETTERVEISTQTDSKNSTMIPWRMAKQTMEMRSVMVGEERDGRPTEKQAAYARYLAKRMCQELPKEYSKKAYAEFIDKWKPVVKHEDDAMNEPSAWQVQYM